FGRLHDGFCRGLVSLVVSLETAKIGRGIVRKPVKLTVASSLTSPFDLGIGFLVTFAAIHRRVHEPCKGAPQSVCRCRFRAVGIDRINARRKLDVAVHRKRGAASPTSTRPGTI